MAAAAVARRTPSPATSGTSTVTAGGGGGGGGVPPAVGGGGPPHDAGAAAGELAQLLERWHTLQLGPTGAPTTVTPLPTASPAASVATVAPRSPELRKGRGRVPPSPPPELAPPKRVRRLVLYDDGGFPGGASDDEEEEDLVRATDGSASHTGPRLAVGTTAGQQEAALARKPASGDDVETLALYVQRAVRLDAPAAERESVAPLPGSASFMPYIL